MTDDKGNSQIISSAKDQLKKALTDFEGDLNDPKSNTRRKDIAKIEIKKFRKMLMRLLWISHLS